MSSIIFDYSGSYKQGIDHSLTYVQSLPIANSGLVTPWMLETFQPTATTFVTTLNVPFVNEDGITEYFDFTNPFTIGPGPNDNINLNGQNVLFSYPIDQYRPTTERIALLAIGGDKVGFVISGAIPVAPEAQTIAEYIKPFYIQEYGSNAASDEIIADIELWIKGELDAWVSDVLASPVNGADFIDAGGLIAHLTFNIPVQVTDFDEDGVFNVFTNVDVTVVGTDFVDNIKTGNADDEIRGFIGLDTVDGGGGTDKIILKQTSADLNASPDANIVNVEAVSASEASSGVTVDLKLQTEKFLITGSNFADFLTGGAGNDELKGGDDKDILEGGVGADQIDGGADLDVLTYKTATSGIGLKLGLEGSSFGDASGDTVANVEFVVGSQGSDQISIGGLEALVFGSGGGDELWGTSSSDRLYGDYLVVEAGAISPVSANIFLGLLAAGLNSGVFGNDTLHGNGGADWLYGGQGVDQLFGDGGADTLVGGQGNDTLNGGQDNDVDTAVFSGTGSNYTVYFQTPLNWNVVGPDGNDNAVLIDQFKFDNARVTNEQLFQQLVHPEEIAAAQTHIAELMHTQTKIDEAIAVCRDFIEFSGDLITDANLGQGLLRLQRHLDLIFEVVDKVPVVGKALALSYGFAKIAGSTGAQIVEAGSRVSEYSKIIQDTYQELGKLLLGEASQVAKLVIEIRSAGSDLEKAQKFNEVMLDAVNLMDDAIDNLGLYLQKSDRLANTLAAVETELRDKYAFAKDLPKARLAGDSEATPDMTSKLPSPVGAGSAAEGYVAFAQVFGDANGDGVLNDGEVSSFTTSSGAFISPSPTSTLVVQGGIDIATGLPLRGYLSAPAGAGVVTPLTTLVVTLTAMGIANAHEKVLSAFDLDPATDLTKLDPIAGTSGGDPLAAGAYKAGIEVFDTITLISSALAGNDSTRYSAVFELVVDSLAEAIVSQGPILDLADHAQVTTLINRAIELSEATFSPEFVDGIATIVAAFNTVTEAVSGATGVDLLLSLSAVALVAQDAAASQLRELSGGPSDIATVLDAFMSEKIAAAVAAAKSRVGDVDGPLIQNLPVARGDSYSTTEGIALNIPGKGVLINDIDADGDVLNALLVDGPSHGDLTLNTDGSFSYVPVANYHGLDTFTYRAKDGTGQSNIATTSIEVTSVNGDPTVVGPIVADAYEDSGVATVGLLAGATDPEGDVLAVADVIGLVQGITLSGNYLQVDASDDAFQSLTKGASKLIAVSYKVIDGNGGFVGQTAQVVVTGVNDPALITGDDAGAVTEDTVTAVTGSLAVADVDDGEAGFLPGLFSGTHGILSLAVDGAWTYTLDNNSGAVQMLGAEETLADTVLVQSVDGTAASISITITGADEPAELAGTIAINDVVVAEGDSGSVVATLTVSRSGGTAPFQVQFSTEDGAATSSNGDYVSTAGTLSFSAGEMFKTVAVTILGDTAVEGDEAFFVNLTNASTGAVIADGQGLGTILNDDVPDHPTPNVITGTNGRDYLRGTPGEDLIDARGGNDLVKARSGDDTVLAGSGHDRVYGDRGDDDIHGGTGNDWLNGGKGDDFLFGDDGKDKLIGGQGEDLLKGGAGNDKLRGDSGNDCLYGGDGNDKLVGGKGRDFIDGGACNDWLEGGKNTDTFHFGPEFGRDVIADFRVKGYEHDVIAFDVEVFADWGELKGAISNTCGGVEITFDCENSITILGVSKAQLVANHANVFDFV